MSGLGGKSAKACFFPALLHPSLEEIIVSSLEEAKSRVPAKPSTLM